jgi:hypothetical protein
MKMAASTVFGQHRKDVGYVPNNIVLRYVIDFFRCYQRLMKPCSDGKDSNTFFSGLPSMLFQESIKPRFFSDRDILKPFAGISSFSDL